MNTNERPKASTDGLEANTRRVFDASVQRLDGGTRSRLAAARAAAVSAVAVGEPVRAPQGRYGLAALAAAAALAFAVVWLQQPVAVPGSAELTAFEDLEILLDEEELELFEDLEFYAWLEQQPEFSDIVDDSDGSG